MGGCSRRTVVADPSCGVVPSIPPGPEGSKGPRSSAGTRGVAFPYSSPVDCHSLEATQVRTAKPPRAFSHYDSARDL